MDMRVQGGTRGLLSAIAAGKVDPLDPSLGEEIGWMPYSAADRRMLQRRDRRRTKKALLRDRAHVAERAPF